MELEKGISDLVTNEALTLTINAEMMKKTIIAIETAGGRANTRMSKIKPPIK